MAQYNTPNQSGYTPLKPQPSQNKFPSTAGNGMQPRVPMAKAPPRQQMAPAQPRQQMAPVLRQAATPRVQPPMPRQAQPPMQSQPMQRQQNTAYDQSRSQRIASLNSLQQSVYQQAQQLGGSVDPLAVAMGGPQALAQARSLQAQEQRRLAAPQGSQQLPSAGQSSQPMLQALRDLGPSIGQYGSGGEAEYMQRMRQQDNDYNQQFMSSQPQSVQRLMSLLMPSFARLSP